MYRICRRFQKVLCCWGNTCLLHNEWNKGNLCRENNKVTQKYLIQIYGGTWIQKPSQIVSIRQDIEFKKNLKILHTWTVAISENFRRWPHKISPFSKQSNTFPQKQNTIAPKLPGRIHSVPKRKYSEPAPRKLARFEKKSKSQKIEKKSTHFLWSDQLGKKDEEFCQQKRTY